MNDEVVFSITKTQVITKAKYMGLPEEAITDDVLETVRKGIERVMEWSGIIEDSINMALKS